MGAKESHFAPDLRRETLIEREVDGSDQERLCLLQERGFSEIVLEALVW